MPSHRRKRSRYKSLAACRIVGGGGGRGVRLFLLLGRWLACLAIPLFFVCQIIVDIVRFVLWSFGRGRRLVLDLVHVKFLQAILHGLNGMKAGPLQGFNGALRLFHAGTVGGNARIRPQHFGSVRDGDPRFGQVEKDGVDGFVGQVETGCCCSSRCSGCCRRRFFAFFVWRFTLMRIFLFIIVFTFIVRPIIVIVRHSVANILVVDRHQVPERMLGKFALGDATAMLTEFVRVQVARRGNRPQQRVAHGAAARAAFDDGAIGCQPELEDDLRLVEFVHDLRAVIETARPEFRCGFEQVNETVAFIVATAQLAAEGQLVDEIIVVKVAVAVVVNGALLAVDKVQTIEGFLNDDQVSGLDCAVARCDAVRVVCGVQQPSILFQVVVVVVCVGCWPSCSYGKCRLGRIVGGLNEFIVELEIVHSLLARIPVRCLDRDGGQVPNLGFGRNRGLGDEGATKVHDH